MEFCLIALVALATVTQAHPTRYPNAESPNCSAVDPLLQPDILSYHVHIVFGFNQLEAATRLRDITRARFAGFLGPDCDGRFLQLFPTLQVNHVTARILIPTRQM